ncbi:DinB family protein [Bacillus sp. FJAT-49736]|uniref:DinB family protein n=1 Tax=Bacillus sp. FJAT-49736 TaxID=2833582 RepID=UPI0020162759|nr:DinB family protein [Bacillus sp. FJAT-49736]
MLTSIISNPNDHLQAVKLFLKNHALVHSTKLVNGDNHSLENFLLDELDEDIFRWYPVYAKDTKNSIAWHFWHIARIEDMTMNILVADRSQVLHEDNWLEKLNISFPHSGNEMTDNDIEELSLCINIDALLEYRIAVGKQTRKLIMSLQSGDFKEKVQTKRVKRLFDENALLYKAQGIAEYWSKKTIGGLVLMPATRHNFLHLNKCIRIKNNLLKKKGNYRSDISY